MGLLRFDRAIGTIDSNNLTFYAPNPYVSGTLLVFLNGQQKDPDGDDGFVESDPALGKFTMKEPPLTHPVSPDVLWVSYENQLEASGGGADGGSPRAVKSLNLRPVVISSKVIAPEARAAEDESDVVPDATTVHLRPHANTAQELRPTPISAEET